MKELAGADVVVVGSGAAGLTAALAASDAGARVVVLERSEQIGGTTAVSGGALWIPLNHHMAEVGIADSREDALAYTLALTAGRVPRSLVERLVDSGHEVVRRLEADSPVAFTPWNIPDYRQEQPGAKPAARSIEPALFDRGALGVWADRIRPSPILTLPLTLEESSFRFARDPASMPRGLVAERMAKGILTVGNALVGMLLAGCLERGVEIVTGLRVRSLVLEDGQVRGVRGERNEHEVRVRGRAVVLASGGFEWNPELVSAFLSGRITHPQTPPANEGDGLLMAMEAGASLANMSEAWWYPSGVVPGELYDGRPLSRQIGQERSGPHTLMVNGRGERFVNEAANYNDMAKALFEFDVRAYGQRNLPCWVILDRRYRSRSRVLSVAPADPDPDWLIREDTLERLARRLGIPSHALVETVERFNALARAGEDRDFGRGASRYDRATGDVRLAEPNLGTLEEPPFYALPVHLGAVGTKGGPRIDEDGRVLDVRGRPMHGLYAAGNVAGSPAGPAYFGGGTSIGCGVVFGWHAGQHAARLGRAAGSRGPVSREDRPG